MNGARALIPMLYNSESRLTMAVKPDGNNRFDFHLSTSGADLALATDRSAGAGPACR